MTQLENELLQAYGLPGLFLGLIIWHWRQKIVKNGYEDPTKIIMSKLDSIESNQKEITKALQAHGERITRVEAVQDERGR